MTNFAHGRAAEDAAAEYLKKHGYMILDLNWRTRYCEIDIVAQQKKTIYFVEVKYRENDAHGSGLEYITEKKLQQMRFAAEMWVQENDWRGDYDIVAIEVSGPGYDVTSFTTNF